MSQITIEQEQKNVVAGVSSMYSNGDGTAIQGTLCAWCLSEQGMMAGNGSHGICVQHAQSLLRRWRERGSRRQH